VNKPYGEAIGQVGENDPFAPTEEQDDPFAPVDSQPGEDLNTTNTEQQDDPFAPQDSSFSSKEDYDPFAPQNIDPLESSEMQTAQEGGIGEPEIQDPFAPQEEIPYEASLPEPEIQAPTQAEQDLEEEAARSAKSLLGYGAAAAQQISGLFGTSKEASGAVLLGKMKEENDKMLAQGWDRSKDYKAYDAELRKRTQAIVGGMVEEGTRIEAMGGPDAFLQGRANMGRRKTAKQKAVKDFDVNLLSRSLGSGFLQTGAGLVDAGATVANLAGMDSVEKYLTEKGKAMLDVQGFIPFEVNGVEDVSNIMDVGALIAKATGEMAPQVALSYLAGGGLLAGASKLPVIGQIAAKSPLITRSVGGFLSNAALETGGIAREQLETVGEINPKLAIGGGALAASFESIADTLMFKNLWKMLKVPERELLLKELATKSLKQIALTVAEDATKQGVAEFATEAIQEMIDYLGSDLAKKDPDFIKFINNPDFNSQYWGEISGRILDAGVQGAAGGVGLTSIMGAGTKAYYTNKARRIYGEMKAAEQELKSNLETLRKAADAAEASGSPQTAEALREQGRKGVQNIINRRYDAQGLPEMMASADQKTTETEQKEQAGNAPQTTPKPAEQAQGQTEDQDLANFEETGDTFDSEEAAASYINTLPDKQNYQIVDNSDVDPTTGDIISEFMLIKRKVSVTPNEEQKPEEAKQAEPEAAVTTATTAEEGPQTEAVASVETAKSEPAQESQEAVAPALEIQENKKIDEESGVEITKGKMTDPETGAEASYTIIPPIGSSKGSILLSSLKTPEKNRQKGGASKLIKKLKEKSKELDAPIKLTDTTKGTDLGFYFRRGFRKSFDILRTPVENRTKELQDKYSREYGGDTIYEPRDENIVTDKKAEQEKSPGHIGFYEYEGSTYELYKGANGDLFRAPVSNVFDANTGYRIGRWEAPARMADEQAAKILGKQPAKIVEQETVPPAEEIKAEEPKQPKAELSNDLKTLVRLPEKDFMEVVGKYIAQDLPESRASAFDLLLERYLKASVEGKGVTQATEEMLEAITAAMEANGENQERVERWKVQRSTDGLAEGVFSVNGLGTFDKPGKGWNAYAPNVKGVPDYQNKIYNEAIAQWSKIILDINAGVRGRTKVEAEAGKKTPPVIGDSKSAWVEYGKNLASVIARNAVSRVAEANRTSRMLSYDAMENPQFSEDDAMKYNDEGEVNEVSEDSVPGDKEIDTQEAMAENEKRSQKTSLIKEELEKIRNESNDPLVKAVYDYHLGKLGMPNESGFDQSTTYDEVGESVIDKVKQPNGKPYSYASIGTMARQKGPEVERKILEALKKYNDQVDESVYRDIIRPEAAKKDRRTASKSARGLRELKSSIFARIGALKNKDLISNFQKAELLDLVPNDLSEELTDQLKAELDTAAEQEDLDSDLLIQNIKERIQNYDAQKYSNDQGVVATDDQRPEVDVREQADLHAQDVATGPSETNSVARSDSSKVSGSAPDVQVGGTERGSGAGAEAVAEELPADDGSVEDEAAGKVWQATLNRAVKAAELGIIDNNALDIIKEGLTRIISSPNSDFDETISALSEYLDAAENKALQDELEGQGIAGALGESSSRGSERPQRSEPRVQGSSDKDSPKKDRQGVRENPSEQKAVSGGDKGQERVEAPEKRDGERRQIDNGPRPGLATSFEKLIPTPKKEYVKLGDFGLDENQAKAVNLMVQAYEEGKKAFILGDGTGMGKTLTYMVAGQLIAEIKGVPVLLVALNDLWVTQRYEADLKRFGLKREAFLVRTYTQIRDNKENIINEYFSAVIFDEAHTLKNESTKTSEMAGKLQGGFKIFATATPLDEVKQAAYFLSELTGESEDQVLTSLGFEVSYDADPNVPGGLRRRLISKENKRDTDRALGELAAQAVRNGQYVRRYYPFWGKIKRVEVKLTEDQAKDYQKQIRYWDRQESMASNPGLVRGQKTQGLKRWTETIKGKYILENSLKWLEENPTGKIVVMTDTAASQKIKGLKGSKAEVPGVAGFLYDAFTAKGYKAVKIFGNKNQKDTFGPLKQFQTQDPSVRVAISTIASGGTGIDLDDQFGDRPRLVWFAGTNFAASKVEQAMGRTSRRNTKSPSELRIVVAPESYGDTRAEEIKNQKMLNLRAIQGQAIEEEETSEGGRLTADNATLRPVTKYYEDAELSELEGAQVDTRIEEQTPEVQNTVREFAKVAGANFTGVKIVFAEYGKNTAWADPATLAFDTIYINPELLHEQFKGVVTSNPETSKTAMEFIVDEEMSHNNYFKLVYDEALALGVDPAEYLNEELNKIASGLTEGIKETVRQVYENKGGGKITSNGHLVLEYMRMLDQLLRKGATTELKLTQDPNIPKVFQQFLPRSSVPMEGQSALYRLFESLINFFKAILDRKGMSPVAKKAVEERLEKLGKLFAETSNPVLGSFGNRPVYDSRNLNRGVPSANLKISAKEIESNETLKGMHEKFKEPSNGVWQQSRQWLGNIVEDTASQAFDYYAPVRAKEEELVRAMREKDPSTAIPPDYFGMDLLPAEQSAFKMMRLAADAWQTTDYSLHKGIPVWHAGYVTIKDGSKGLFQIFGQLGNPRDADLFRLYMVAKRAQELQGLGKDSNFSEKEIEEGVTLGDTKSSKGVPFKQIFKEYREYQDGVLQFAIDSGLVSDELAAKLREMHKNYVPYYRVLENADTSPGALPEKLSGPFSKKQVAGQRSGVKRFVGGKDPIGDLYENILKNISHLVEASVRNTAMLRLERINKDLEDLTGQNFWAAVSPGIIVNASVKDFLKYLRGAEGININDSDVESSAFAKVFGMAGRRDLDPERSGIISFMRKGKPVYRKIEEGNRRLLQALTMSDSAWGGWNSSLFVRAFAKFRTIFQKSITMGGEFIVRNLFRDTASSATLNKGVSIPFVNTLKGIIYMRTHADQLEQIRGQGAGNPSSFSSGRKVSGMYDALPQLKQRTYVVKTVRSLGNALMLLDKIGEKTEAVHRTAVTIDEVKRSNLSPAEAAWVYKQSNTDFSAHGANKFIRLLSATVPFFNAGLQSLYRVWGSYSSGAKITNDMTPTKAMLEKLKPRANDLMFKGALLTALALLYAAINHGDDRYEDLTDYEKDNFWIFFVGNTKIRVPKPYEIGTIFFTIPEIIASSFLNGELPDRNRILSNLGSIFRGTVPGLPQAISPVVQIAANYDMFRGSKIVPQSLENIAPSLQYKENTPSILTEGLARVPGLKNTPYLGSPLVQQKLVEGYLGTMGQYMLILSSEGFDKLRKENNGTPVEKNWQDRAIAKSFFAKSSSKEDYTYPTYPTKYGKQFYEIANLIVQAENTIRDAKKMTDDTRREEYFDEYLKTSALSSAFTKYREAINDIESTMRNLRTSESEGSSTDKRLQIEELQRQKNEILKSAVKLYQEYEKEK
jgi:hypothetical protein